MSVRQRVHAAERQDRLRPSGRPWRPGIVPLSLPLGLILASLPVVLVDTPPIFDYANHLARAYVIARFSQSPLFQAHFQISSFVLPNVLADVVLLALLPLGGAIAAGKALMVASFALTVGGASALNRALTGRLSAWPLLAALLLYNEDFFWGFLNYDLGLGLLLCGLAAWVASDGRPASARLAVGTGFALLTFLAHMVSFGLYGVAIAAVTLHRLARRRPGWRKTVAELLPAAGQFVLPLALFLWASPTGELSFVALFDFSIPGKIMPFARLLSSGNPAFDIGTGLAVLGLIGVGLVTGIAQCHPMALLVAALYLALVMALPYSMLGSYFLDSRIVIAVALVFVAGLRARRRAPQAPVALAILALVGLRSAVLLEDWRRQAEDYGEVLAALAQVPAGSVVVTAVGHPFELGDWVITRTIKPSHEHTTLYATIFDDALVPNIFAREGQNPLVFRSALPELDQLARNPVPRVFTDGDARWLVDQVLPVADRRTAITPAIPAVYIIGYQVPCGRWPADRPIRLERCAATFSLVQVLGGREPVP